MSYTKKTWKSNDLITKEALNNIENAIETLDTNVTTLQNNSSAGMTETQVTQLNAAYTHSQSTHAPSTAQKNSDITKSEIEAKLTGNISTHTHIADHTHSNSTYINALNCKFWFGTEYQYSCLTTKDPDTYYFCSED